MWGGTAAPNAEPVAPAEDNVTPSGIDAAMQQQLLQDAINSANSYSLGLSGLGLSQQELDFEMDSFWAQLDLEKQRLLGYIDGQPTLDRDQLSETMRQFDENLAYLVQSNTLDRMHDMEVLAVQNQYSLEQQAQQYALQGDLNSAQNLWQELENQKDRQQQMAVLQQDYANQYNLQTRELGMDYLELLSEQRGPSDWAQTWNVQNQARNLGMDQWGNAVQQSIGYNDQNPLNQMPGTPASNVSQGYADYGTTGNGYADYGGYTAPDNTQQMPYMTDPNNTQAAQGNAPAQVWAQNSFAGKSVSPWQWNNLPPSQQEGIGSLMEAGGQDFTDWQNEMQQYWPTGNIKTKNYWG